MSGLAESFLQDIAEEDEDEGTLVPENIGSQPKVFNDAFQGKHDDVDAQNESDDEMGDQGALKDDVNLLNLPEAMDAFTKLSGEAILSKPDVFERTIARIKAEVRRHQAAKELVASLSSGDQRIDMNVQTGTEMRASAPEETLGWTDTFSAEEAQAQRRIELDFLSRCNRLVVELDQEIMTLFREMRIIYNQRFPELEQIVTTPLEYVSVVSRAMNNTDLSTVDLSDILPNTTVMAVTVAASMATGRPLSDEQLDEVKRLAEQTLSLAESRTAVLQYLEIKMSLVAPNLTALTGASLAAQLITHAGGIQTLAKMPAQNLLVVGGSSFSRATSAGAMAKNQFGGGFDRKSGSGIGIIYTSDIVQSVPLAYRRRALRLMAGKCSLAARRDLMGFNASSPSSDEYGRQLRIEIVKKLVKAQEPQEAPMAKPLPVPDETSKPKRGGKKHRHYKLKYGLSEMQKQANRLKFGVEAVGDYGQEDLIDRIGMSGYGNTRVQYKEQKVKIPPKRLEWMRRRRLATPAATSGQTTSTTNVQSSGQTGGLSSSLVFSPAQGIELVALPSTGGTMTTLGTSTAVPSMGGGTSGGSSIDDKIKRNFDLYFSRGPMKQMK